MRMHNRYWVCIGVGVGVGVGVGTEQLVLPAAHKMPAPLPLMRSVAASSLSVPLPLLLLCLNHLMILRNWTSQSSWLWLVGWLVSQYLMWMWMWMWMWRIVRVGWFWFVCLGRSFFLIIIMCRIQYLHDMVADTVSCRYIDS